MAVDSRQKNEVVTHGSMQSKIECVWNAVAAQRKAQPTRPRREGDRGCGLAPKERSGDTYIYIYLLDYLLVVQGASSGSLLAFNLIAVR